MSQCEAPGRISYIRTQLGLSGTCHVSEYASLFIHCMRLGRAETMTRSALRDVHSRFSDVAGAIDRVYKSEHRERHWGNMMALVVILLGLCADSILCDRFIKESELLVPFATQSASDLCTSSRPGRKDTAAA